MRGLTQAEVSNAVLDLSEAITTYTNAQKDGTKENSGTPVNTVELKATITDARAVSIVAVSINGSEILPSTKWTTRDELNAFDQAIADSETVFNDAEATQEAIDQANADLEVSIANYETAQKAGTKVVAVEVERNRINNEN